MQFGRDMDHVIVPLSQKTASSVDAFDFNANNYRLPYDRTAVLGARPFDYRLVNIAEPRGSARGATSGTGAERGGAGGQRERAARPSRG